MNRTIHELINMKARKIELELELGTSTVDVRHLSSQQLMHINRDYDHQYNPKVLLDMVNETIHNDEQTILNRH
ncbi:hypothetical protein EZV73_19805 [Acidaminobacter sp. JC074]|uniref:hypothetical protein n=1 Tax=Acidaminobacter sp. JC074 TaxID=2530199 RepID=UPI001F0FB913|nr:hypothetical protein [Acidaminobacter sp. JC074]MCH4889839.1 hypothetical protein [Acidaminobacter sp. JC074]